MIVIYAVCNVCKCQLHKCKLDLCDGVNFLEFPICKHPQKSQKSPPVQEIAMWFPPSSEKRWDSGWVRWDSGLTEKKNGMCESLQPFCHPPQECRVISSGVICAVLFRAWWKQHISQSDQQELSALLLTQAILSAFVLLFLPVLAQTHTFPFVFRSYQIFYFKSLAEICRHFFKVEISITSVWTRRVSVKRKAKLLQKKGWIRVL